MSRSQRRKDVIAAVIIVGTAIIYWTSGSRPDVEDELRRNQGASQRPVVGTDLPGLRSPND